MVLTSQAIHSEEKESPHRILIVDDEPAVLFAYCKMMQREGIMVDKCECLEHAISSIKSTQYMAVIADMRLAGTDNLDGLEVVRSTREIQPDATVIVATGYGSQEVELAARKMGVTHYFEKPVRPSDIMTVLKRLKDEIGQNACAAILVLQAISAFL